MPDQQASDRGAPAVYLASASPVLASVGAYRLEGLGAQLFSAIDGDYFTVLGLPLIPILEFFRREGVLAS